MPRPVQIGILKSRSISLKAKIKKLLDQQIFRSFGRFQIDVSDTFKFVTKSRLVFAMPISTGVNKPSPVIQERPYSRSVCTSAIWYATEMTRSEVPACPQSRANRPLVEAIVRDCRGLISVGGLKVQFCLSHDFRHGTKPRWWNSPGDCKNGRNSPDTLRDSADLTVPTRRGDHGNGGSQVPIVGGPKRDFLMIRCCPLD